MSSDNKKKFLLLNFVESKEEKQKFVAEKKLVNIGFPAARMSKSEETKEKIEHRKRQKSDPEFERLSRRTECK